MLHQFAYTSQQAMKLTEQDLQVLLKQSRRKNKNLSLTGLLLYDKGVFLQVLEGPKESIDEIRETIKADIRHNQMDIIYTNENLHAREFSNWRMGFKILGDNTDKDFIDLDNRIKKLLDTAKPNSEQTHDLLLKYKKLKSIY